MAKKPVQLDEKGYRKFGIRDSISYAAGDLGCNMSFALKGTMALFWTQVMGMGLWYSLLLVIVQVCDAINDPLIGSLIDADRHTYKRNKFLQYIWVGSIGLIVGGACCFLPFPQAPVWAKAIIFIAGYVIWDAFYTIANVPYGSLLSLISDKAADRASLSAWRSIGSMIGNMLPMPIIYFFARKVLEWGRDKKYIGKFFTYCIEKGEHGGQKLRARAGRQGLFVALLLFVGIPLPGTGAWTGSLIAALLDMPKKKSIPAILLGIAIATVIMSFVSYGLLDAIISLFA
jgi:uncharacterized membrane protein